MRKSLLILAWFIVTAGGVGFSQQTTTTGTFVDPDGTAWNAGTYSIQYVNSTPGKPYNTSTGAFITTLYTGSLNSSGALSLTLDDVKYVSPANGTWAFTICPNVSGGASNCSTVNIPVTGATENVSSLVNAALRAPRPGGGVGAYGYADVEFQSIPGNTYVVSPALTVQRCYAGSWAACGAGGGGGTPATPVQSPQINQQGTFGSQQNVYVAWSGDTLTSLASVCASNPSTIEVSASLTLVPTVATALPANCNITFLGNGEFVNNTAYPVTINGKVNSDGLVQRFGTGGAGGFVLGSLNTDVPAPWFGAACNGAGNDLTAIQNALNAITNGQVFLPGLCDIAGTLNVTKNNVGIRGIPAGRGGQVSGLVETVAGDPAISEVGASSSAPITLNTFQDFTVTSSVAQTGTTAGMNFSFTGGLTVRNVVSSDFFHPFYIHASPSYQSGGFYNDQASWSTLSSAMTSPVGFYLDGADGNGESSLILEHNGVSAPATGGPSQPWGLVASGTAINDWLSTDLNVAFVNGVQLNYTGSGTNIGCSDIHLVDTTIDNFLTYGMQIENLSGNCTPSWEVSGGWIYVGPNTAVTGSYLMDIENSSNGTISHTLQGAHSGQLQSLHGDYVNGSSSTNVVFTGNSYYNQSNAIDFNGSNGNAATGNSDADNANIDFSATNGATYNSFVGNQMTGLGSGGVGIYIPIINNDNTYVGNTCNSAAAATCINDGGTGNGAGNFVAVARGTSVSNSADSTTGTSPNLYSAFQAYGPVSIQGNNAHTPTAAWAIGFNVPGGSPDTNTHFDVWNGTTWNNAFTVNNSTWAANFAGAVTAPSYSASGTTHGLTIPAGTASAGAAGSVVYGSDATNGYAEVNENNTGLSRVCTAANGVCASGGVADTTITVGATVSFAANTCSSVTGVANTASTVAMTGLATTMTATFTPNSDVHAVTGWSPAAGGQLYFTSWPSASGTLSYYVCNGTGTTIVTGGATTWNISAR